MVESVDGERGAVMYQDIDTIHAGRCFLISRSRRTSDGTEVIVKRPRPGPCRSYAERAIAREHEILRTFAELPRRPRISAPIEFIEPDRGGPALVLADAGPMNLHERLGHRPLDVGEALSVGLELARILSILHQHRILHRDINPFNIITDAENLPILIDFDAATRVIGLSPEDVPAELAGTLHYLAPEQTGRMSRGVDQRADLYAAGATLYEVLTGSPPFAGSDAVEIVHAHLARTPVAPCTVNPRVPRPLSDIVLRLLAKAPEHRYQSAEALAFDLDEAYQQWRHTHSILPFDLGRADVRTALPIPHRLYGRDREIELMTEAVTRAAEGARELIVLRGPTGAGKTALISELARIRAARGAFAQGKAEQVQGDVPYTPWTDAIRPLLRQILEAPAADRERWERVIFAATGRDAALLSEIFPELDSLFNDNHESPANAAAALRETRFRRALVSLVRCLATEYRPLILVFDDLQWVDPASFSLLQLIATEPDCPHLLLVAVYRTEGVPASDRLPEIATAARSSGATVRALDLAPLDEGALTNMLGDTLQAPGNAVRPLAKLVLHKTAGNALFVRRFLETIHQRGWITFDATAGNWVWDDERIEHAEATANVVALMRDTINKLPAETQAALRVAACFFGWVELDVLADVTGEDRGKVAGSLWIAFKERLLVGHGDQTGAAYYRFEHDRVQEAAYELLTSEERQATHLAIGRQLLERSGTKPGGELFDIVDQLDRGSARIEDQAERRLAAKLNAEAGTRARTANAYRSALTYCQRGLELLGADPQAWRSDRALAFRLHRDAAECAYLLGDYELGDGLVERARAHEASPFECADLANLQVIAISTRGDMEAAIRRGREGLAALGMELSDDLEAAWQQELARVRSGLRNLRGSVVALERMDDPTQLAIMELLANLLSPAYVTGPHLFAFLVGRIVNLSIDRGNSVVSAFAYAALGMVIGAFERDYPTAYQLGRAGADLAKAFDDPVQECRTLHVVGCFINHWRAPLRSNVPYLRRAVARGMEGGELQFAVYAAGSIIVARFHCGEPLDEISAETETFSALASGAKVKAGQEYLIAYRQAIRSLKGHTRALGRFDDDGFDEAEHLASCAGNPVSLLLYDVLRLQTAFLARQLDDAETIATGVEKLLGAVWGLVPVADYRFFHALAIAAAGGDDALARIRDHQAHLRSWAEHAPDNFRQAYLLVEAELARLEDRGDAAAAHYDDAIDAARGTRNERDAAVASELAARFWHQRGRRRIARLYFREALEGYAKWGANAKVAALEHEFPDVALSASGPAWDVGGTWPEKGASLDLMALHKAYETLSSEVVLERLLDKLMAVSMEVAGATGAALFLDRDGSLALRASAPSDAPPDVFRELIDRARATNEPIAVGDPMQARALGLNVASRGGRAQSILALPIRRGAVAVGVLYLENRLTTHAFTAERVRVLTMLASQAAISLENSTLFEGLNVEIVERKRAEESVRFLADAGAHLSHSLHQGTIVARLVRLPVPFVADWCVVKLVKDGALSEEGAFAYPNAPGESGVLEMAEGAPLKTLACMALESGAVQLQRVSERIRAHVPVGTHEVFAVPLIARDQDLGVLMCGTSRCFPEGDRVLLQELGRRAAFALDNALHYARSQESVSLRDEFLSIASHELKTPLTSLRLAAQGLIAGTITDTTDSEPLRRVARVLERQTARLAKLVEDLLNVSRIHAGRLHLVFEHVNLEELAREVLERFEAQAPAQRVSIERRATDPIVGRWDRARLDQVVTNLVSNAFKFGAGRPITLAMKTLEGRALLSVTDSGIGIAPERLGSIFERFERAVSSSHYGGLGLGLYISRQIVASLGGEIRVESEPGTRTTFVVDLPLAGPEVPPEGKVVKRGGSGPFEERQMS